MFARLGTAPDGTGVLQQILQKALQSAPVTNRPPRKGALAFWLGWFVALNVLWLAFISAFDLAETVLGLVASAIAATAAEVVHRQRLVAFHARATWLLDAWRLPGRTVADTVLVFGALGRRVFRGEPLRGRFRTEPFRLGPAAGRREARRAVFTVGASIPPNAYVVGIDEDEHTALLHELVPTPRRRRKP